MIPRCPTPFGPLSASIPANKPNYKKRSVIPFNLFHLQLTSDQRNEFGQNKQIEAFLCIVISSVSYIPELSPSFNLDQKASKLEVTWTVRNSFAPCGQPSTCSIALVVGVYLQGSCRFLDLPRLVTIKETTWAKYIWEVHRQSSHGFKMSVLQNNSSEGPTVAKIIQQPRYARGSEPNLK
jgi:hypothetical protein